MCWVASGYGGQQLLSRPTANLAATATAREA
jgi:hypothetical protein